MFDLSESDQVAAEPATKDPDLTPVEVESEICLDQELEALKRTGNWDDSVSMPVQQSMIDDFSPTEVLYDFPITVNRQVEMYLDLFQGKQRKYFAKWLSRSGRYLPLIHEEFEKAGLPLDLAYLAMIESGFSQLAYSRSRAVGLWQFMQGTGKDYNLEINRYIDERRDAIKSTQAAAAYLGNLYSEFGDWYLAVAAYNGGPGTMRKAIKRHKTRDFWKIAQQKTLRLETKRYVPKLIAAIIIAKNPEEYGFTNLTYEPPLFFDTIAVGPGLSFEAAALLTNSDARDIKQLNQELKTGKTPLNKEQYLLKIPNGTKTLAERNMPRLHSVVSTDYKTHIIRKGETLARICKRYNVNTTTLLKVNNLKSNKLVAGDRLRIPFRTIHYRILPEGMDAAVAAKDQLILHTIKRGETISKISKQYQVPPELIVSWNGLPSVHKITAGQQLALYLNSASTTSGGQDSTVSSSSGGEAVITLSDKTKTIADTNSVAVTTDYRWYLVKSGDSLWTISRRFNTSPAEIRKWNNLKTNRIYPGNKLKVKDV